MKQTFDLIRETWIPVVRMDGTRDELNLRDFLLHAHKMGAIYSESSSMTAALYRFFLALSYAIFQPQDRSDWQAIWQRQRFDSETINQYLAQPHVSDRFDLLHAVYPFYQSTDQIGKPRSLASLLPESAGGNNATLFEHSIDEKHLNATLADAARLIITAQAFSLGGGNSGIKGKNFTDAPCSRGVLCFAEGKNLFETLVLNLIPYEWQEDMFIEPGTPAWEMDNAIEDDRTIPDDLLDYLTWQSRRLNLAYENDTLVVYRSQALSLEKEAVRFDPLKPYRATEKDGYKLIRMSEDRALWRSANALFRITGQEHHPAKVIDWLATLVINEDLPSSAQYHLLIMGLSTAPGKATKYFSRVERIPLPLKLTIDEDMMQIIDGGLSKSEEVMKVIRRASECVGLYLQEPAVNDKKWQEQLRKLPKNARNSITDWIKYAGIERHYWASLDLPFQNLIINLPHDTTAAKAEWQAQIRQSAQNAFAQAAEYVRNDGRSFKAIVRGQSYLNYRLNEILPKKEKAE